jgi:hypothetical protein
MIDLQEKRLLLLNFVLKGDMNRPSRGLSFHEDSKDFDKDFEGKGKRFLQVSQVLLDRCLSIDREAYPGSFQGDDDIPPCLHHRFFHHLNLPSQFYGIFHLLRPLPSDGRLYRVVEGIEPQAGGVPKMPL